MKSVAEVEARLAELGEKLNQYVADKDSAYAQIFAEMYALRWVLGRFDDECPQ